MSIFQFFIIITTIVFIFIGIDLYKRKKVNILHISVFVIGGVTILLLSLKPHLIDKFGKIFGVARGTDIFIYLGIITLFYFYMELLNIVTKDKHQLTKLISQLAIKNILNKYSYKINKFINTNDKDNFIILIRARNEASIIGNVIEELLLEGYRKIFIINDGSTDNTEEIVKNIQIKHSDCLIILGNHTINRGGGAANQTLYNFMKLYGDRLKVGWGITYDADGQMDYKNIDDFIKHSSNQDLDLLLGSRFIDGGSTQNMPRIRRLILVISRFVTKIFYKTNVTDPHMGFRMIKLDVFKKFNITSDGMHYANEINEQIQKHNMKYIEIPINIKYTTYSLSKGQKNSNSIKIGLEMIYKKIFFR